MNCARMIRITINSEPVEWTTLCYHFQRNPKPGGATYNIAVSREESSLISYLEEMVGKAIDDPAFEGAAMGHWATTYNLVQYVLWEMEKSYGHATGRSLWVLNNIGSVVVTKDSLTITGICSPFLENFGSKTTGLTGIN